MLLLENFKDMVMKKYCLAIISILVLVMGIISCSNEEAKTQNQMALRPTVPLQNGEVRIGTQIWMTKNLNVSRYRNGDPIPQVANPTQWANLTSGAWCYYNNDSGNGIVYGKLYNWYAVVDPRGLAPQGWHIPARDEWSSLFVFLGGDNIAGAELKELGTLRWNTPNLGATNSSRFSGLPGGMRNGGGSFSWIGNNGFWWTTFGSTGSIQDVAWYSYLSYNYLDAVLYSGPKNNGLSVRCIRN